MGPPLPYGQAGRDSALFAQQEVPQSSRGYGLVMSHLFHSNDIDISPEQLRELTQSGEIQLVDVREPYEWEAGRIAGARHIELERLASKADTLDKDKPVYFYCRLGARSGMAAQAFRGAGFQAHSMDGGLTAWVERGFPLEPEDGRVEDH